MEHFVPVIGVGELDVAGWGAEDGVIFPEGWVSGSAAEIAGAGLEIGTDQMEGFIEGGGFVAPGEVRCCCE